MKNVCDRLPLYLYKEMDEQEMAEFEKHLLSCPECRQALETFEDIQSAKMEYSAPQIVIENIFNKTTRKKRFWSQPKIYKTVLAAAACLLIGVAAVFKNTQTTLEYSTAYNVLPVSYEEMSGMASNISNLESINML
ncbi:MAG: zf-HC2 domain-containing protein [Endomicrobium sp.]|jgi:uncharacterized protein YbaR (Trm112 family)|nr:zf-HC2 domain-containing protein [Endomicrobium sp.]